KTYPDAYYTYYKHDHSLRRMTLGNYKYGFDYFYTLEGWLKAINHPDPAQDAGDDYQMWPGYVMTGPDGSTSGTVHEDVFSEILYYYDGDFKRMNSPYNTSTSGSYPLNPDLIRNNPTSPQERELYDGNIAATQSFVRSTAPGGTPGGNVFDQEMGYRYEFDELGRLITGRSTHKYASGAWIPNQTTTSPNINDQYTEHYLYDQFGMKQITRYAPHNTATEGTANPLAIDFASFERAVPFTIPASPNTNKVTKVADLRTNITELDIPLQTDIGYDKTGRVTYMEVHDEDTTRFAYLEDPVNNPPPVVEESVGIYVYWTVQNTVDSIVVIDYNNNNEKVRYSYLYDANGNRVREMKESNFVPIGPPLLEYMKYYIRTADGKDFAMYKYPGGGQPLVIEERYAYGAERLGYMLGPNTTNGSQTTALPDMNYEVTDHLGNVRLVVPEHPTSTWPAPTDAVAVNQYYAFGALQPFRNYATNSYPRGYNGQEREDKNIMGTTGSTGLGKLNYARYWEYNPHIALRWNMDPKPRAGINPYDVFNGNPILNVDLNGDTTYHFSRKGKFLGMEDLDQHGIRGSYDVYKK
ncbi:MAG: hypothetical protein K8F30_11730, partial [Taibaiella sp.]|nr:hypothetical protein [Taibaiella sp.]